MFSGLYLQLCHKVIHLNLVLYICYYTIDKCSVPGNVKLLSMCSNIIFYYIKAQQDLKKK